MGKGTDADDAGTPLPADALWQAELWRCLRTRIATPGPAERLEVACERLEADHSLTGLPQRWDAGLSRSSSVEAMRSTIGGG